MVSGVLDNSLALNDILDSLSFESLNQSLYSNNFYTSQGGEDSYS